MMYWIPNCLRSGRKQDADPFGVDFFLPKRACGGEVIMLLMVFYTAKRAKVRKVVAVMRTKKAVFSFLCA